MSQSIANEYHVRLDTFAQSVLCNYNLMLDSLVFETKRWFSRSL
jgi:hypothetical protein